VSLQDTQDQLTSDPRILQQRAMQGDIHAMARLYKILQDKKSQQVQQGLGAPAQVPTVKDQVVAAASGLGAAQEPAMAAGGRVRDFAGGGDNKWFADDGVYAPYTTGLQRDASPGNDLLDPDVRDAFMKVPMGIGSAVADAGMGIGSAVADAGMGIGSAVMDAPSWLRRKLQDIYTSEGSPEQQAEQEAAARAVAAKMSQGMLNPPRVPVKQPQHPPSTAGLEAALPDNQVAASAPDGPMPETMSSDASPVSPSGAGQSASKVKAASAGDAPDNSPSTLHMDAWNKYVEQLTPLQQQQLDGLDAAKQAEMAAYARSKDAKKNPDKWQNFFDTVIAATSPFSSINAQRHGMSNMQTGMQGGETLAARELKQREADASAETAHQKVLSGLEVAQLQQRIANLGGAYTGSEKALSADQLADLNQDKLATRLTVAGIAHAGKGAGKGAGGGMKEKDIYVEADRIAKGEVAMARKNDPMFDESHADDMYAAHRKAAEAMIRARLEGKPVPAATPAPAAVGGDGWGIKLKTP
jgi:hypothetical protein